MLADAVQLALEDVTLREQIAAGGLSTMAHMFSETRSSHAEQVIERIRALDGRAIPRRGRTL